MKNSTFNRLLSTQSLLAEENSRLAAELGVGTTLHSFMHYPWTATTAEQLILQPDEYDERAEEAVGRVIDAYQRCAKENVQAAPCMWDKIEGKNANFLTALAKGSKRDAGALLTRLFQSNIIWGLGKFDDALIADMLRVPDRSHAQLRITDALVSLAQAVGAYGLTSVEQQGVEGHLAALRIDLEKVLADVENLSGLDVSAPRVGASYGCRISDKFVTIDSLLHSYSVHRLLQLGATRDTRVMEIGGGFGCLAQLAFRAGLQQYSIFDLPWVNAIQGYYLIMSLPKGSVRLYGESAGTLEVNPFWTFEKLPDRSVQFLVNTDSMPEMGRETALNYIKQIRRVLAGLFLSTNQEAKANNAGFGLQNSVAELVREVGGLRTRSRSLYWMRQGYVEEVFTP
jgi:hypothetical protein